MRGVTIPSRIHRTAWPNSNQLKKSMRKIDQTLVRAVYFFVFFIVTTIEIMVTIIDTIVKHIDNMSIISIALLIIGEFSLLSIGVNCT